jgi:hypothetical protein
LKRITEITKNAILELFKNGIDMGIFETHFKIYPYYGHSSEIDFLKRLYQLDKIRSSDSRYTNAEKDIWQHIANNDDYEPCWIFNDERFPLKHGFDEEYLKFICEIFHPAVCIEGELSKKYFDKINSLIRNDRYELYAYKKISGRNLYNWRTLSKKEVLSSSFLPLSERQDKRPNIKTISKKVRKKIIEVINKYNFDEDFVDETNLHYSMSTKDATINEINGIYVTKAFNEKKEYIKTDNLDDFIFNNYPIKVLDAIEMFNQFQKESNFSNEINEILKEISFQLVDCKIEPSIPEVTIEAPIQDESLKGLVEQAESLYKEKDEASSQLSIEKLWDALERVKTLNGSTKMNFIDNIFSKISTDNIAFKDYIDKEFKELTNIGNNFQIRHFETNKVPINDNRIREYLYGRCSALLTLILKFIDESQIRNNN